MPDVQSEQSFYAWLAAPDPVSADKHFGRFYEDYRRIFEGSTRQRYRNIAQYLIDEAVGRTMLEMLERFGAPRHAAFATVAAELVRLQPVALGELHAWRVRQWKSRLARYRLEVLGFAPSESERGPKLRERVLAFNAQRHTLEADGRKLLSEIRMNAGESDADADDATAFAQTMETLLATLPQLRVLTPSYVFAACRNELSKLFREARRNSGHGPMRKKPKAEQKTGFIATDDEAWMFEAECDDELGDMIDDDTEVDGRRDLNYGLAQFSFFGDGTDVSSGDNDDEDESGYRSSEGSSGSPRVSNVEKLEDPSCGPDEVAASNELYGVLLAALKEPIRAAELQLAQARTNRDRERARIQLDRALREHARDSELLVGWSEDEGQEEAAARLGLTRNEVRHGLKRAGTRILAFCQARNIAYGESLVDLANGRPRRRLRMVASGFSEPDVLRDKAIDKDASIDGDLS